MHDDVIDEAIKVAAARTHSAQEVAASEIEVHGMPHPEIVDAVVQRAEDLEALTADATEPTIDDDEIAATA